MVEATHGVASAASDENCYESFIASLFEELNQTERSAKRHPAREADRLGDTPPADALRAVSKHAERVLEELPKLACAAALPSGKLGRAIGELFTNTREFVTDRVMDAERSYRATLLGIRHGVDLVKLTREVARVTGHHDLETYCTRWLAEREPLVDRVEAAMYWFATHPKEARTRATSLRNGH